MRNKMGFYLDRLCAAGAGAVGITAAYALADGDTVRGGLGFAAVAFLGWLSTSETRSRGGDRYRITATDRDRLRGVLRNVYGGAVPYSDPVGRGEMITGVLGDAYGTPVTWCLESEPHRPHLWPIHGPAYAPALCMGHECSEPERHIQ